MKPWDTGDAEGVGWDKAIAFSALRAEPPPILHDCRCEAIGVVKVGSKPKG